MTQTAPPPTEPRPAPRLPLIPGPVETAGILWRKLRRMSTALVLLFALTTASVLATFVPQAPNVPTTVIAWRQGTDGPGEAIAGVLDWLGLFDVFGAWWFNLLVAALFVSLTGCLVPRYRAFARVVRRPPDPGRNLERLSSRVTWRTSAPPDAVLAEAECALRGFRRRRVVVEDHARVAAERGHWREGGSLVFHTAFYLLLLGVVIGKLFGFTGQEDVFENGAFTDARVNYDLAQPGRWFGIGDHRGFTVRLDDFDVSYFPDFTPRDFVSTVTILEDGEEVRTEEVRVNHPLVHDGMKLYQARFGLAPHVRVWLGDLLHFDGPVRLGPSGPFWQGSEKILVGDPAEGDPQVALDFFLAPNAELGPDGQPVIGASPVPDNPVMLAELYVGDLGLERAVSVTQFDRTRGSLDTAMLREGTTAELAQGAVRVEYVGTSYWSGFQVSHAPGRWLLLLAAILVLGGLIPSLYSYRRRVWVDARPAGDGSTEVTVAGVALQRKTAFTDEFSALAQRLRGLTPDGLIPDKDV